MTQGYKHEVVDEWVRNATMLYNEFSGFRAIWGEISEIIRPLRLEIKGVFAPGNHRQFGIFDGTAQRALQNFAAGIYGTVANPADAWFKFETLDPDLNKFSRVREWMDLEARRTLASYGPSYSNFYAQAASLFLDLGALGNGIFSEELNATNTGFIDMCRPISECVWDVNAEGDVDTIYRRWTMSAGAAGKMFKEGLSKQTQEAAIKRPETPVRLIHAVMPNFGQLAGETLKTNKPFISGYAEIENCHLIEAQGYFENPFFVPRWEVGGGEKCGRGPGEMALADARSVNVMQRDNLKAGNRAADPSWAAHDELQRNAVRTGPGKVTYGAINSRGDLLLRPNEAGGNPPFALEITNQVREAVKETFFFSLMQLAGRTGMTATEILERQEEKMRLMGPYVGRTQTDFLSPHVTRRFNMLRRLGLTSPPPPELQGRTMQVSFISPFAQAQRSARANAVLRTVQVVGQIATFDPEVADRLDSDRAIAVVQEGFGAPADILRSDEETDARRQVRRQMQQAATTAQIAQAGAGAAQKGAAAVQTLQQPQQQAA